MPLGLWATGQQEVKVPEWYNIDWFRENFKKKFKLTREKVIESQNIKGVVTPHRVLFVSIQKSPLIYFPNKQYPMWCNNPFYIL